MSNLISVIVPVYNASPYLQDCINSILAQTYKDFELLLLDDGSTDSSLEICKSAADKDDRVIALHHENCGVSATRNKGISMSRGEYIAFVDADDMLADDYLEKLHYAIISQGSTTDCISICRFNKLFDNGEVFEYMEDLDELASIYYPLSAVINAALHSRIWGCVWRMLIPKSLIVDNNILFENCHVREDQLFLFDVIANCKTVSLCDEIMYIYRHLSTSACHKKYKQNFAEDQTIYLDNLQGKLKRYELTSENIERFMGIAMLNVRVDLLSNASNAPKPFKELKNLKSNKYFRCKLAKEFIAEWKQFSGKTARVVMTLDSLKLTFLIPLLIRLKSRLISR